jgi:formylglycine-generating enzyme required for sulfatase activity
MKRALERHEAGKAIVIPVIVRDCDWEYEAFAQLQIPNEGKAIANQPHGQRDTAYTNVVKAIRNVLEMDKAWETAKKENTKEAYQHYLDKYPTGLNVKQAKQAINRLTYILPKMIFVAGGKDQHGNTIPDFWIGKYTVTNEEYAFFLNRYGSDTVQDGIYKGQKMVGADRWGLAQHNQQWQPAKGYERHPVVCVSWYGTNEYCNWLKQETGEDYQLPDEWHWEWAARGGQKSQGYQYAGSNNIAEVAWYGMNSYHKGAAHPDYGTHRVGEKKANELGLYDMSGNVWEWCRNQWEGEEGLRVVRGGSWLYNDINCAVSVRYWYSSNYRGYNTGVRVSRY